MVDVKKVFQYLPNQLPMGIILIDDQNKVVFANELALNNLKLEAEELIGKNVLEFHSEMSKEKVLKNLEKAKKAQLTEWEALHLRKHRYMRNVYNGVFDAGGKFLASVLMTLDITDQVDAQFRTEEANQRLLALFNASKVINSSLDLNLTLEKILDIVIKVTGFDKGAIYLKNDKKDELILASCLPSDSEDFYKQSLNNGSWLKKTSKALEGETCQGNNNLLIPLQIGNKVIGLLHGFYSGNLQGLSEKRELLLALGYQAAIAIKNALIHQEITEMAIVDSLTSLYNRKHFNDTFSLEGERMARESSTLGALMIDINHLKKINDALGHLAGDFYIKEAAHLIKQSVRKVDYVFRFGGDEILVLCPTVEEDGLKDIETRIRDKASRWNSTHKDYNIDLSLSIGWSLATSKEDLSGLLERADALMYEDKRKFYEGLKKNNLV